MTKETKKNIYLLVGSLLFCLLTVEVALRFLIRTEPVFYRYDPVTAVWHRSGKAGWFLSEGPGTFVRMNKEGLRDREHVKTKPSNVFRIAVLGDSYAEAMSVEQAEAFWAVMEDRLQSVYKKKPEIEVLNFGVAGFGTAQELLTLRDRVWQYSPDLIVLAFLSGNDVRNNLKELEPVQFRPFFIESGTNLVLDDSFSKHWNLRSSKLAPVISFVIDNSRLAYLVRKAQRGLRARQERTVEAGLDFEIYAPPRNELWSKAWRTTTRLIQMTRDEVASKGAKFLVVSLSSGFQVHPDGTRRKQFVEATKGGDPFYPEKVISEFCRSNQIPLLTCAEPLLAEAEKTGKVFHGFFGQGGHYNAEGNRAVGELIANFIVTNSFLSSKDLLRSAGALSRASP